MPASTCVDANQGRGSLTTLLCSRRPFWKRSGMQLGPARAAAAVFVGRPRRGCLLSAACGSVCDGAMPASASTIVISGARPVESSNSSRLAPTLTPAWPSPWSWTSWTSWTSCDEMGAAQPWPTLHVSRCSVKPSRACYSDPFEKQAAHTKRFQGDVSVYHLDDPPTHIRGGCGYARRPSSAASLSDASAPAPLLRAHTSHSAAETSPTVNTTITSPGLACLHVMPSSPLSPASRFAQTTHMGCALSESWYLKSHLSYCRRLQNQVQS